MHPRIDRAPRSPGAFFVSIHGATAAREYATIASLVTSAVAPALLLIVLRRRDQAVLLNGGPGIQALLVSTVVMLVYVGWHGTLIAMHGWPELNIPGVIGGGSGWDTGYVLRIDEFALEVLPGPRLWVGGAVASLWFIRGLMGRRRPRSNWLDLTGILLGLVWILSFAEWVCNTNTRRW
jgi:hypothetical protein